MAHAEAQGKGAYKKDTMAGAASAATSVRASDGGGGSGNSKLQVSPASPQAVGPQAASLAESGSPSPSPLIANYEAYVFEGAKFPPLQP
jgi:hypothetical protein